MHYDGPWYFENVIDNVALTIGAILWAILEGILFSLLGIGQN